MKYHTKLTFKIFFQHARKYSALGLFCYSAVIFASIANVIGPLYYKRFFDLLAEKALASELIAVVVAILSVNFIGWAFWRLATFTAAFFQSKTMENLANTCFAYLHKHSFSFFNNNFVGSLVKKVNRFTFAFEGVSDIFAWDLIPLVVETTFITVVLFKNNTLFGVIVLIWIFIFAVVNYLFTRYKLKYDIRQSELDSKCTGVLADTITNNSNVKLFAAYEKEKKNFGNVINEVQSLRRFRWNIENIFEAGQTMLMIALEFAVFYFAIGLWQKGLVTVGDFVLLQAYILVIFHRFWSFGRVIRRLYENLANAEEMTEILDTPHEITDSKRAKPLEVKKGKIKFDNVNFNYHKTRRVIDGLNLTIKAGERIALVGPSGAGKSTVIKLLLRQHDITSGKILIDGQRISQVTQESLWQNISLVPQDPILFHRTLMDNIRYGKSNASDEEVIEAAKAAHCHEFITETPEGYETYVGERGIKLSGGERQRVAIARAILRNAPILVLDEATSSLDSESEQFIQDALSKLMKGKTVIVIAHRLSTIMTMDRIIVVDQGKVTEQGVHDELVNKKKGLYARLWKVQVGGFIG